MRNFDSTPPFRDAQKIRLSGILDSKVAQRRPIFEFFSNLLAAIMHDVTRFHTCVERVSGSNPTRWIGVVPLAVQRV